MPAFPLPLKNENLFQFELSPNIADATAGNSVKIRCPHCQVTGIFPPGLPRYLTYGKERSNQSRTQYDTVEAHIRVCPNSNCAGIVFTLTHHNQQKLEVHSYPPELLDFNAENLPPSIVSTLKEAISCHANGAYRACAMMVRRLLEELCHECGAEGPNLHSRLGALKDKITLPNDLFDAMYELKALGNDAAHIEAKAFDNIDEEEARLSIELAQEILKARYQHQNLVNRLKSRRKS